jgi:hypothetical protein
MDRLVGIVLFLPVPLVLWLFTQQPLGTLPSVVVGVVIMATHRLYARPFALSRSLRRCLWTGGPASGDSGVTVTEPLGTTVWATSSPRARTHVRSTLGTAHRLAPLLRVGILGPLVVFIVGAPLAAAGWLGPVRSADTVALFQVGVALGVLPLGWWGPRSPEPPRGPIAVPFPVHIPALIGTLWVVWLFRVIGLWWLAQGIRYAVTRF